MKPIAISLKIQEGLQQHHWITDPGNRSTRDKGCNSHPFLASRRRRMRRAIGLPSMHAERVRSRHTDSRSMPIAATAEQRSERAGKGNEAVRVSGVGFSSSSLSLLLLGSLHVWAEGTAHKAAWVSGDPLRRNAKSNVGATLAVTRASRQGPQEWAGDFYARASVLR